MTREIDETKASWSYAELWDKYPIPARPDSEEIEMERNAILNYGTNSSEVKLMILGSTIEYRSLCKQLSITPYVVDFAKENFDALTSYSKEKFDKEYFEENDWLQIQHENFFDIILGHRPFNVIRHDQVLVLFEKMFKSLKPGGLFFCRGNVRFSDDSDNLAAIIEKWAFAPSRPYKLFSYIEVSLYAHCADENGYLDYPKARDTIKNFYEQGKINESDYKDIIPLISMPAGTKFRSYIHKDELEGDIKQAGFSSIEWLYTNHEFTKNMPIIKLVK